MTSKKFTVYGNCQAYAIAANLLLVPEFSAQFKYCPMQACFAISKDGVETFHKNNSKSLDLVLSQALREGWHGESSWDVQVLLDECMKDSGRSLIYPELYLRTSCPALTYPINYSRFKNIDYQDIIALALFSKSALTVDNFINIYSDPCFLSPDEIREIHQIGISNISSRAIDNFDYSEIFDINIGESILFHTFNHPSVHVLKNFIEKIFKELEFLYCKNIEFKDILGSVKLPVLNSVTNFLNLPVPNNSLISIEGNNLNITEYIDILKSNFERVFDKTQHELSDQRKDLISKIIIDKVLI